MSKDDFAPVAAAAAFMREFPHPWWIAGGWAIDLFVGHVTREHGDIEIGSFWDTQLDLRRKFDWAECEFARDGVWYDWELDKELDAGVFQVRAWNFDFPYDGEIQFFFDGHTPDDRWVFRRRSSITLPADQVTFACDRALGLAELRFLAPEIQLLYKAKYDTPKQEHDFLVAAPMIPLPRRAWLKDALADAYPGHAWITRL